MLDRNKAKWLGIVTIGVAVGPMVVIPAWLLGGDLFVWFLVLVYFIAAPTVMLTHIVLLLRADSSELSNGIMWPWLLLVISGGSVGQVVSWYLNFWRPLASAPDSSSGTAPEFVAPVATEPEPMSVGQVAARARMVQYGKPVDPAEVERALSELERLRIESQISDSDYLEYRRTLAGQE